MATLPAVSAESILQGFVAAVKPNGQADERILAQMRRHAQACLEAGKTKEAFSAQAS